VLSTKGKGKGQPLPDADLRDTENVPLGEDEIPFNRHFYVFKPPRPLAESMRS